MPPSSSTPFTSGVATYECEQCHVVSAAIMPIFAPIPDDPEDRWSRIAMVCRKCFDAWCDADDKLPQYPGYQVEFADCVIRIMDYCGSYNVPIGEIIRDKLKFNLSRADHKPENRSEPGGKQF